MGALQDSMIKGCFKTLFCRLVLGSQLDELQKMNLVPQSWLLRVYAQHYHAVGCCQSVAYIASIKEATSRKTLMVMVALNSLSLLINL